LFQVGSRTVDRYQAGLVVLFVLSYLSCLDVDTGNLVKLALSRPDSDVVSAVLCSGKIDLHRYRLTAIPTGCCMPARRGVNIQGADDICAR